MCPVRLLAPQAVEVVEYVRAVAEREPLTGQVIGVREWPDGGRLLDQPAAVVEAVYVVLGELQALHHAQRGKEEARGTART